MDTKTSVVEKVCNYIKENYQSRLTLGVLSREASLSEFYFQRIFKQVTGITPRQYVEATRINRLKLSLKGGAAIRRSIYNAGYNTSSWLYSRPNAKLGMSPLLYKKGGEGLSISYITSGCPLGRLLVAATERGVCAVSLGDSDEKLFSFLSAEYPRADLRRANGRSNARLASWVREILDYLTTGKEIDRNLPLDFQATAFQWRVFKELQSIPYGSTRSYSDIAKGVGSADASRAVGNACNSNPTALVIPCHRVVRKNGDLGGYRWGIERKKFLLKKEGTGLPVQAKEN